MNEEKEKYGANSAITWPDVDDYHKKLIIKQVAYWFTKCKLKHKEIAYELKAWAGEKFKQEKFYNASGNLTSQFVGYRLVDAAQQGLLELHRSFDDECVDTIKGYLGNRLAENIQIIVAPDRDEMLRYVWFDLDMFLRRKIESSHKEIVVGVSGGKTLLDLANKASDLKDLAWHATDPIIKDKVVICSLTSGGIRTNIEALSDMVAANMAYNLKTRARGLLGPAWFSNKSALEQFKKDKDVIEHNKSVEKADIILTSIGYLGDERSLMRQLLDKKTYSDLIRKHEHLSDLLYNLYDGESGKNDVQLPKKVADHIFSVMNLDKLKCKIDNGTECYVLASGRQKGFHSVRGILINRMASRVYLDRECAEGLLDFLSGSPSLSPKAD